MSAIVESREVDRIEAIRTACMNTDGIDPFDEATALRLRNHGLAPRDRLWFSGQDGFALSFADAAESTRRDLTLAVRPGARRQGVAAELLRQFLHGVDQARVECFAWSHGDHPAARALARRTGFDRARALWVLRRTTRRSASGDRPASALTRATSAGVTIRSYQPDDAEALIAINSAAFADHPEQAGMDAANLAERMAQPWFDPQGLLVAEDVDKEMLGFHWTKLDRLTVAQAGRLVGEVYVIGVAPAAHGQGVGRQLMEAGLDHLAGQGVEQVILYVESTNAPALALYESLGFTHADPDTHVLYHRHPGAAMVGR